VFVPLKSRAAKPLFRTHCRRMKSRLPISRPL
jgi:hypothetical protein